MTDIAYLEETDFTNDGKLVINDPVVCLVYANWCPPCQQFKPTYYKLADHVNMKVACIELDGHLPGQKELADKVKKIIPGMEGTPTVVLFVNGRVVSKYNGDRSLESLIEFCS